MQSVSNTYRSLWGRRKTWLEAKLVVAGVEYGAGKLFRLHTDSAVFSNDTPAVGGCIARELDAEILATSDAIPRMAELKPFARLTNGTTSSEWVQKGTFYIDTRSYDKDASVLILHGYDAMLKTETDYTTSGDQGFWPKSDIEAVNEICSIIGVRLDARTKSIITRGYQVNYPGYGEGAYSMREVLSSIAAMYAGNFIMSDIGELRLIQLGDIPEETNYLIDQTGDAILIGGDRILV